MLELLLQVDIGIWAAIGIALSGPVGWIIAGVLIAVAVGFLVWGLIELFSDDDNGSQNVDDDSVRTNQNDGGDSEPPELTDEQKRALEELERQAKLHQCRCDCKKKKKWRWPGCFIKCRIRYWFRR